MKIYKVPTINDELITFNIEFKGRDKLPGTLHFLEHCIFNTNKVYHKDKLSKELSKYGCNDFFSARTGNEGINLSGSYLKKDAVNLINILNTIINTCTFEDEDVEQERRIITQEYAQHFDDIFYQAWVSIGELMNENFNPIGTMENIAKNINQEVLISEYNRVLTDENAIMYIHNGNKEIDYFSFKKGFQKSSFELKPFDPYYEKTNENISSSIVFKFYNEPKSFKSVLLAKYLSNNNAPFFKIIREKYGLAYQVGATSNLFGNEFYPYLLTYALTEKETDRINEELKNNFKVDDEDIFNFILKEQEMDLVKAKNNIWLRLSFEKFANDVGIPYEELRNSLPTWDEFKKYAEEVKEKEMSTIVIKAGRNKDE